MKQRILPVSLLVLLVSSMFLISCESSTNKGECIGLTEKEKPGLDYRVSKRNAVLMFAFGPISIAYTLLTEIKCPR